VVISCGQTETRSQEGEKSLNRRNYYPRTSEIILKCFEHAQVPGCHTSVISDCHTDYIRIWKSYKTAFTA